MTKNYKNHFLNIALAYGGQYELVDAVKKIGEKIKGGELQIEEITKEEIESNSIHITPATTVTRYDFTYIRGEKTKRISNMAKCLQ